MCWGMAVNPLDTRGPSRQSTSTCGERCISSAVLLGQSLPWVGYIWKRKDQQDQEGEEAEQRAFKKSTEGLGAHQAPPGPHPWMSWVGARAAEAVGRVSRAVLTNGLPNSSPERRISGK